MSCEKATRRLRCIINKAKRMGLSECELADLSASRRITNSKSGGSTWSIIAAMIVLTIAGIFVLILACNPCTRRSHVYLHRN